MSEYQYYAFRTVDRLLSRAAQAELRALSTRARIDANGFTNHYDYGDFSGDPNALMERHFDLHIYLANWGTRVASVRLPAGLVDEALLGRCVVEDAARVRSVGGHLILDITRGEIEEDRYWGGDDEDWIDDLSELRADLLAGGHALLYLAWLVAVADGLVDDEALEPAAGLGPLTASLEAIAEFFGLDQDLVEAAATGAAPPPAEPGPAEVAAALEALDREAMLSLLVRAHDGDAGLGPELRQLVRRATRPAAPPDTGPRRSLAELRAMAERAANARQAAAEAKARAQREREAEAAAEARRERMTELAKRGVAANWRQVEAHVLRRNPKGYAQAIELLSDLRELATEEGKADAFEEQLVALRVRHFSKPNLIRGLEEAGLG